MEGLYLISSFGISFLSIFFFRSVAQKYHLFSGRVGLGRSKQDIHETRKFIPRIGGICILASTLIFLPHLFSMQLAQPEKLLLVGTIVAFMIGCADDLGLIEIPSYTRWLMLFFTGSLVSVFGGPSVHDLGFMTVERALPASILTGMAYCGVASGINFIDGLNGLAGGVVLMALATFSIVLSPYITVSFMLFIFIVIGGLMAFLVWNYPHGKVFLGDGGAYASGFLLAGFAMLTPVGPGLSPWWAVAILFLPLMDSMHSLFRRGIKFMRSFSVSQKASTPLRIKCALSYAMQPEKVHLHHLLFRFMTIRDKLSRQKNNNNPISSFILLFFVLVGILLSWPGKESNLWSFWVVVFLCVVYGLGYRFLTRKILSYRCNKNRMKG